MLKKNIEVMEFTECYGMPDGNGVKKILKDIK